MNAAKNFLVINLNVLPAKSSFCIDFCIQKEGFCWNI